MAESCASSPKPGGFDPPHGPGFGHVHHPESKGRELYMPVSKLFVWSFQQANDVHAKWLCSNGLPEHYGYATADYGWCAQVENLINKSHRAMIIHPRDAWQWYRAEPAP